MIVWGELRNQIEYNPDTGLWRWRKFGSGRRYVYEWFAGSDIGRGYRSIMIDGVKYPVHKLAWFYVYGDFPYELDHVNRDPSDNRIENLRIASHSENVANQGISIANTSGYKGVSQRPDGKYQAYVFKNGRKYSKLFSNINEAAAWRRKRAIELFGEFAIESVVVPLDRKQGC